MRIVPPEQRVVSSAGLTHPIVVHLQKHLAGQSVGELQTYVASTAEQARAKAAEFMQ
jgi:hypothetical protein